MRFNTESQRYRDSILLTYTIFPLCLRDSVFDILRFDTASKTCAHVGGVVCLRGDIMSIHPKGRPTSRLPNLREFLSQCCRLRPR